MYIKDVGTGLMQPVIETPTIIEHPIAWSHDEKSLLVFTSDDKGTYLSSWSFASRTLTRLVGPRVLDTPAFFSPRDDFVAFTSQESGRPEVYVTTFPDHRQTWPITTEGGQVLSWRERRPRDPRRDARGAHRSLSGVDRRRLLARRAHDARARHRQPGGVQHGHARPCPHPHSREAGRCEGQGRNSIAVRLARRAAPGRALRINPDKTFRRSLWALGSGPVEMFRELAVVPLVVSRDTTWRFVGSGVLMPAVPAGPPR